MNIKKELYTIFENPNDHSLGIPIQIMIFSNIIISIIIMFLQTEKELVEYKNIFSVINTINISIFTIEYILRIYSISYKKQKTRLKYAFSPFMLIDFIVLLPYYLSLLNMDLGFLRALRIIRIFKLFRLMKFAEFDNLIGSILKEKKEEFIFIAITLFILILTVTPLVYYFEKDVQPEVFTSMGTTMWWAIITFTTVGYGDMYPITIMGRILTTIVSFLGIAFYAIPGSIFTSALLEKIDKKKQRKIDRKKEKEDLDKKEV